MRLKAPLAIGAALLLGACQAGVGTGPIVLMPADVAAPARTSVPAAPAPAPTPAPVAVAEPAPVVRDLGGCLAGSPVLSGGAGYCTGQ